MLWRNSLTRQTHKKLTPICFFKIINCQIVRSRSLPHRINYKSVRLSWQVNSKTAHPPGQFPGIWPAWPKMRPARWGIWLSCQNVCQRSEAKGFRNSLIQHVSGVHGSLLLSNLEAEQEICSGWKLCRTCFHSISCFSMPGEWGIWPSLKL